MRDYLLRSAFKLNVEVKLELWRHKVGAHCQDARPSCVALAIRTCQMTSATMESQFSL